MMARAGEEIGVNLAVSLHAVNKEVRDEIVPLNRKYGIEELLEACAAYPGANNARRITFEYVMLKDKNDSDDDARELVRLISSYDLPAKVNLIPFNPWPGAAYECSTPERIRAFSNIVFEGGISAPVRTPRGRDIDAACGQLKTASEAQAARLKKGSVMKLIGKVIDKLLKHGSITIVYPDGRRATYGPGGGKALTMRITDRKVLLELVRNPRLGLGEAYMDGRLIVENGTILDLLELVTSSNRWEDGAQGAQAHRQEQAEQVEIRLVGATSRRSRGRTSLTITTSATRSTNSSSTTTCNTAALTSPIRPTASSRRRPTRKRTSPPSST